MIARRAIVLRGPPCGGKSAVSRELINRVGTRVKFVSLDDGWLPGQHRFADRGRYADLETEEETLLVELGFGEPFGESFAGATRDPGAWIDALIKSRRSLYLFLLQPMLDIVQQRILQDRNAQDRLYFMCAALRYYRPEGACTHQAFASRLGARASENVIDTGVESKEETANRILKAVGIA